VLSIVVLEVLLPYLSIEHTLSASITLVSRLEGRSINVASLEELRMLIIFDARSRTIRAILCYLL
jgi:hypothetical protein